MDIRVKGEAGGYPLDLTLTLPDAIAAIMGALADLAKEASTQLAEERKAKAERLRR